MSSWASDYSDYVEAKKEFVAQDQDYLDYLKGRQKYAEDNAAGLRAYKKEKAWREWRAEYSRRIFVFKRDRKDRQPASILRAEERQYDALHAADLAEIERDRLEFIRLRDIRAKARKEVSNNPISESVLKRNLEPWNE